MSDQKKREIIERATCRVFKAKHRHLTDLEATGDWATISPGRKAWLLADVETALDAADHFDLRKAAEKALKELRAYRRLNGVVPALNVVDGPVERELEAALKGGGESE